MVGPVYGKSPVEMHSLPHVGSQRSCRIQCGQDSSVSQSTHSTRLIKRILTMQSGPWYPGMMVVGVDSYVRKVTLLPDKCNKLMLSSSNTMDPIPSRIVGTDSLGFAIEPTEERCCVVARKRYSNRTCCSLGCADLETEGCPVQRPL